MWTELSWLLKIVLVNVNYRIGVHMNFAQSRIPALVSGISRTPAGLQPAIRIQLSPGAQWLLNSGKSDACEDDLCVKNKRVAVLQDPECSVNCDIKYMVLSQPWHGTYDATFFASVAEAEPVNKSVAPCVREPRQGKPFRQWASLKWQQVCRRQNYIVTINLAFKRRKATDTGVIANIQ